jgi:two-component system sensor histidine kinase/response regulator
MSEKLQEGNSSDVLDLALGQFLLKAPVGIVVTSADEQAQVFLANGASGEIFGMLPEAIAGQMITVLHSGGGLEALLVDALAGNTPVRGEIQLGDSGLPQRHVSLTITPTVYQTKPALLWWLNDVTDIRRTEVEWKRRERQLHAVIDAAQDAVFEINLQSGMAHVSARFWQMLVFSEIDAQGMESTSSEAIYHYVRDDYQMEFAASLRIPAQDEPYEWTGPIRSESGQEIWVYMRGRITDTASEPRLIGVITDITAQKEVEENLRRAKEGAEEANRAKSAFLATMSHEIRTPMTAILGSLEYLLETPLVKDQHRMVSIARESGASLLAILNDILDLSKIEAGKLTLEKQHFSPRALIQGACDAAQIVARQKGIYLRCKFAAPPPALITADPVRVRQILTNLVNNAVKFTEDGGVTVNSELEELGDGRVQVRVAVTDTGIGLTDEQRSRLFRAFTQADDSTTRKFGGTGLGLSICQRLVERMGGQIGVYSRPGKGSTFWFKIVVDHADATSEEARVINLNGLPMLLVDSDDESVAKTQEELEEAGAAVDVAQDGRSALLKLAHKQYGVILLEQNLPESKGIELVPAIKALCVGANIVIYTSEEANTIGWAAQEAGVFYLPRSTPYQQFLETMASFAQGTPVGGGGTGGKLAGRVLIAEDTAAIRQILEVQVRGLGIDVDFVENGKQALDRLQRGRYSLVVSDLHMPEVDGYGLVHEWRAREEKRGQGEHLPIVALTADVLIGDASKFIAEGFDDYVAKPVSRDALRALITKWLCKTCGSSVSLDTPQEPESTAIDVTQNIKQDLPQPVESGLVPVDHARLVEILGMDDPEILSESMTYFIDTALSTFESLDQAYKLGDPEAAKGPAHSLKGSARMAGAILLGDIAAELDAAAKKGEMLPERLEACRAEVDRVIAFVRRVYLQQQST